jgi:hypothetical protein
MDEEEQVGALLGFRPCDRVANMATMLSSSVRRISLLALLATLLVVPVLAQTRTQIDVSKLGPQAGARVPDFTLPDQSGRQRNLQSIMGPRGAMLVFLRSADW